MRQSIKTPLLTLLALSTAVLAACGPSPNSTIPGNPAQAKLNAIAITEISSDNAVNSEISLSWSEIPASSKSLKFFRRRADQSISDSLELATLSDPTRVTLQDTDPSLAPGVEYVYSIRSDNASNIAVASAESPKISIINANAIKPFKLSEPATNGATLKDPLGNGHQFSWEDSGTGLYHVQVSNTAGQVLWGAITRNTTISYGTLSGTQKQGAVTGPEDPKLIVPLALTKKIVISRPSPNATRNEVAFQGIGNTAQFRIQVSAIETQPTKGDLASARSIAIRKAEEIRFIAQ